MSNLEKYQAAFIESLELEAGEVSSATMESTAKWDSIGHMSLVSVIEDTFEIELSPEDIVELNSYDKGILILQKYGIDFNQ